MPKIGIKKFGAGLLSAALLFSACFAALPAAARETLEETTVLDPHDFEVPPQSMDLAVNGPAFAMNKAADCPVDWPSVSMTVSANLDKVPVFGLDVAEAQTNFIVRLYNLTTDDSRNLYSDNFAFEHGPGQNIGVREVNLKTEYGWSGVVDLKIEISLVYYPRFGEKPVNRFNKMFLARKAGTGGVDVVVTQTGALDPAGFVNPGGNVDLQIDGTAFAMRKAAASPIDWPSIYLDFSADVDKVPYLGLEVLSAGSNYKVVVTDVETGDARNLYSDNPAHEQSPGNPAGIREINLKEAFGKSGVRDFRIEIWFIYYSSYGENPVNRFGKLFLAHRAGTGGVDSVLRKLTVLNPHDFTVYPNSAVLEIDGPKFAMRKHPDSPVDWPSVTMEIEVDTDKVPVFGAEVLSAGTNYKVMLTNLDTGDTRNLYSENSHHEQSPANPAGITEVSLKDYGWSGTVRLKIEVFLIYYAGYGENPANVFGKLFVAERKGTGGEDRVLRQTALLDPATFSVPETLIFAAEGKSFSMKKSPSSPIDWPSLTADFLVDLDAVPVLGLDVRSAGTNYRVVVKNLDTGEERNLYSDLFGFECSPHDPAGIKEVHLKNAYGWHGVTALRVEIYLIYYEVYGADPVNVFNKLFVAETLGENPQEPQEPQEPENPDNPENPDEPGNPEEPPVDRLTQLDPAKFVVAPKTVDLTIAGKSFRMKKHPECPIDWPSMSMTVKVDLDKVPYFGVDVVSAGTNYKVMLTNLNTGDTRNLYSADLAHEQSPQNPVGVTERNLKTEYGWSGVVDLKIEIVLIYYAGYGADPVNDFAKIFVADRPGTEGSDSVTEAVRNTTVLNPAAFNVPEKSVILTADGNAFAMKKHPECPVDWPSVTMDITVDLDRVPVLGLDVTDAQTNYKVLVTDRDRGVTKNFYSAEYGYERSPSDAFGITEVHLKEQFGWSGVTRLRIEIFLNYYAHFGADPMNRFGKLYVAEKKGLFDPAEEPLPEDYIKEPAYVSPSIFAYVPSELIVNAEGHSFTMQKAPTAPSDWPCLQFELSVDLNAVPYLQIEVPKAEANFSVRFKIKGTETWYNFHSDQWNYECSPRETGLREADLRTKLGRDGIVTLQFSVYIVVVEYPKDSLNTFGFIRFSDKSLQEDETDPEPGRPGDPDGWDGDDDPWSGNKPGNGDTVSFDPETEGSLPETGDRSKGAVFLALMSASAALWAFQRRKTATKKVERSWQKNV